MVLLFFNEPEQNYEPLLATSDKVSENMHSHACGHVTIIQSGSNSVVSAHLLFDCMVLLSLVYTDNNDVVFPLEASKQQSEERTPSHQSRKRERFEEPDTGIVFQYFSM